MYMWNFHDARNAWKIFHKLFARIIAVGSENVHILYAEIIHPHHVTYTEQT